MAKIFTKLFLGDAVYSAGGKTFRKLSAEPQTLAAGLYDANNNLIASWDTLVNTYGMDVEKDYTSSNFKTDTASPYYVLSNNTEFTSGVKIIIGSVAKIGKYSFYMKNTLASVIIDNSAVTIGASAFYSCADLKRVTIGDSVTSIGQSAFQACSNLASITIGKGVTNISAYAFAPTMGDSSMPTITYKGTIAQWNSITKGNNWNSTFTGQTITKIICSDGAIGVNVISFTIAGTQYRAEEGMSWADWVESDFNTGGYHIKDDKYIFVGTNQVYWISSDPAESHDVLFDGHEYLLVPASSGGSGN